jgi:hypothetical protein
MTIQESKLPLKKPIEKDYAFPSQKATWEEGMRPDLLRDFEVTGFKPTASRPYDAS